MIGGNFDLPIFACQAERCSRLRTAVFQLMSSRRTLFMSAMKTAVDHPISRKPTSPSIAPTNRHC